MREKWTTPGMRMKTARDNFRRARRDFTADLDREWGHSRDESNLDQLRRRWDALPEQILGGDPRVAEALRGRTSGLSEEELAKVLPPGVRAALLGGLPAARVEVLGPGGEECVPGELLAVTLEFGVPVELPLHPRRGSPTGRLPDGRGPALQRLPPRGQVAKEIARLDLDRAFAQSFSAREKEPPLVDLRFDMIGHSQATSGKPRHPQDVMRDLGISYRDAEPFPIGDCWVFRGCAELPPELPPWLEVVGPREGK